MAVSVTSLGFGDWASLPDMPLDDAGRAVRAEAAQAVRHAQQQRDEARVQKARAKELLAVERAQVEAARDGMILDAEYVMCPRCRAIWRSEEVREASRRYFACLLCGGRLTPVP
jgi:hypothetical protein